MKFVASKNDLATALSSVARIVENKPIIPILANIKIDADETGLRLTSNNLELMIAMSAPAKVSAAGSTTVSAQRFRDLVQALPAGAEVSFTMNDAGDKASVVSGRCRASLAVLPARDFPMLSVTDDACSFVLPAADLAFLLDEVDFLVSKSVTDIILGGVNFHVVNMGGSLRLRSVATDRQWLGWAERDCPVGAGNMPPIVLPAKTVAELKKLATGAKDGEIRLSVGPNKIVASTNGMEITSRLIDGNFPAYERIVPTGDLSSIVVDPIELGAAMSRVATFAESGSSGATFDIDQEAGLTIRMRNAGLGEIEEKVRCEFEGDAKRIFWNAGKLKTLVDVIGGDRIEVGMAIGNTNSIWRGSDPTRTYLLGQMVKA